MSQSLGMERIPVEPAVLKWARESAGYHDQDAAAKRVGVSSLTLKSWESGELQPTIKQLRKAGKTFKRPLAVLLLPEPPKDFDALRDFRKTPAAREEGATWSPALHGEFRRALSQREVYLELLQLAPGTVPESKSTFGTTRSKGTAAVAADLRQLLDMDSWPSSLWSRPRELLNQAVEAVEDLGILVIQTQDVDINEMRGFSISEWPYPVIALNGSDWPRPRLFTLLHELTHLSLKSGGLCDLHELPKKNPRTVDDVEHFCNEVAAAILMPQDRILAEPVVEAAGQNYAWSLKELEALTHRFGASTEALLLRLISLKKANWDLYWERKTELDKEYKEARLREKEKRRKAKGGPSFYVVKARDLGHAYVHSVLDAYHGSSISSLDVADYLAVRYEQLGKLQEALRR